jgi:1-acyl-sn-glycerol-3-phosphate acyltransferase
VHVKIGKPSTPRAFAEDDRDGLIRAVRDAIIAQSLELGGKGGDADDAIASAGVEGVSNRGSQAALKEPSVRLPLRALPSPAPARRG